MSPAAPAKASPKTLTTTPTTTPPRPPKPQDRRRPRGRPPSLTARGRLLAASACVLAALGAIAGSWQVVGLGVLALGTLCVAYLAFFPSAVFVWRRQLELVWVLKRADSDYDNFVVGRPFELRVTLRNRAPMALGRARVRVFAASTLDGPGTLELPIAARAQVSVAGEMVPRQVGTWHLHGAAVELRDPLGLCAVEAYFPNPVAIQVFPRREVRGAPVIPRPTSGAPHERLGLHMLRARGLGGELRELRDHAPGDPFKNIAWKATARMGRLMVRDLDREVMVTHFVLVDLGPTMRLGSAGATKLDFAVDLAAGYVRSALEAGDRVGLVTFDGRIVSEVKANDGPVHRLRLLTPLLEAMTPVDEDLTEVTDSELVAAVARYLLHQEGLDARLGRTPPIDDPAWSHLATSPTGELYDLRLLLQAVDATLKPMAGRLPPVRASSPELGRLRAFCRARGIELPARRASQAGRRAAGLARALERVATGRGTQRILVISDLEGLESGLDQVARAVRLGRRRGHHLVCAAPRKPSGGATEPLGEIAAWDEQRRERAAFRRVAALGVRVVPVGPGESAGRVLLQLAPQAASRPVARAGGAAR